MISIRIIAIGILAIAFSAQAQQPDAAPVNPDATPAARALLQELDSVSGKATLSGEHNFPNTVSLYSNRVYELTGHYPAVFGQDFGFAASDDKDSTLGRASLVQEVIRQYQAGAVIALCWHEVRPTENEPVTFHESVQGKLTDWEFQQVITPGTDLHARWERQVDRIAGYLRELQDAGVPVLFRPYHEMNGNWFWWGGRPGANGTMAMYRMIYDRYVHVHHLNNLIWVWNVNAPSVNAGPVDQYWPGSNYVDVVALDVYGAFEQSYYDSMLALADGHKPVALAEVGVMPTLDVLARQPRWTYMMMWSGFAEGANPPALLQAIFHAPNVVDRGDPRLPAPLPAPVGPPLPQDLNATPAARAMLAKFSVMTALSANPSPRIKEIDVADFGDPHLIENVRTAAREARLPLLRWTPTSPTGKGGAPLDDFDWSELRRPGTSLNTQWQAEIERFAHLLEQLQKAGTPVLISPLPEPNAEAHWWSAHPGPEGSQALLREIHESFATHHLNNIVWVWEAGESEPGRNPARRSSPMDDFYPGPLSADIILLDQADGGKDRGRGLRQARQLGGPKPLGVRSSSTDAAVSDGFDFVVAPGVPPPPIGEASSTN